MEISYELIDSVALYVLWLALITIALMFFFIYLGIPYSCWEKFHADHFLYKVSSLHLFPYGYGVFQEYFKKRASLNISYHMLFSLFFLIVKNFNFSLKYDWLGTCWNLSLMEKHTNWYGDRTFDIAPKLMAQLYTILKIVSLKRSFPISYYLW